MFMDGENGYNKNSFKNDLFETAKANILLTHKNPSVLSTTLVLINCSIASIVCYSFWRLNDEISNRTRRRNFASNS
jgi:hypothetical protein